jgi:diguanylate cyclase (GGDEF)-like protein
VAASESVSKLELRLQEPPAGRSTSPTPNRARLRVLLVEDSRDDAELVEEMLTEALGPRLELACAGRLREAQDCLERDGADCVLLDLGLPDCQGLECVVQIQATSEEVPVVVLSGLDDEDLAAQAVQEGAQDYLVKGHVDAHVISRAIRYAIERKGAEVELSHRALHDPLTGLPNRTLFVDRLEHALSRSARSPSSVAVLFLDLNRFKTVNDSLGHTTGDRLLIDASHRIEGLIRPSDTLARFGGDEFMILCEDLDHEDDAIAVARRLNEGFTDLFGVAGHEVFIGASIGIAFAREADESAEDLIRSADQAMYRAKERGAGYGLFDKNMHAVAMHQLETEAELHRAIERGELRVAYQPQLDLRTGTVFAVEALVRWEHPTRGLLLPADFLHLAEETGLILPIGAWVLVEACGQLARWKHEHPTAGDVLMCVNVARRQLTEPGFANTVADALDSAGVDAAGLCLEMTESTAVRDPARTSRAIDDLKSLGVTLSLDDFGTGYSSLSMLAQYPIDILKIDRALADVGGTQPERGGIVGAIVGVAQALRLTTVAEGVERASQLNYLRELGCDVVQGYYFARPDTPDRVGPLLRREAGVAAH